MELYIVLLMWLGQILAPVCYGPVHAVRGRYDAAMRHRIIVNDDTAVEVKFRHSSNI
jgi:hypothetical protein